MRPEAKRLVLRVVTWVTGTLAVAAAVFSALWIYAGTHPEPGTGSLGHVGIVIAGLVMAFLALLFGGIALWSGFKARRINPGAS